MTIKSRIKKFANNFLDLFDILIEKKSRVSRLLNNELFIRDFGLLKYIKEHNMRVKYIENLNYSKSQLRQDLFVLNELGYKRKGYFIEFGAANGLYISNTYLLEKKFEWVGLLSEPARVWHKELINNRKCIIEKKCVWNKSGKRLNFKEVSSAEFSTIDSFSSHDNHKRIRNYGRTYQVETISLEDLLDKYKSPHIIDYLSIDTEGSEFSILENFNFKKYKFKIITVEHNFTKNREKIFKILTNNGYIRKYEDLSNFDDWYVYKNKPSF